MERHANATNGLFGRGRIMRLYLMRVATIGEDAPVPSYLIRTDEGRNILIDTGFSPAVIAASHAPGFRGPPIRDYVPVVDRLAALGVGPGEIDTLIATHLDPDHAGAIDAFPGAEIVIQRVQYEAARSGTDARAALTRANWDAPGLRYHLVDGDTELVPGVTLIETSGHVPGHQSVLVRLPETGLVLLAIDAIGEAAHADLEEGAIHPMDLDETALRASRRKLRDLEVREGVALTIYGHDGPQWRTLKLAPDYYD